MQHLKNLLLAPGSGSGLKAKLVKGAMGVGLLKVFSLPLTLLTSVLLARGLGPDGFGQYAFVMAAVTMLALPIGPGIGLLIMREVAGYHYGSQWGLLRGLCLWAHRWVVFGSLVLITLLVIGAHDMATWDPMNRVALMLLASLMLPFLGLNALRSGTLRGLGNAIYAQVPELLVRPGLHLLTAALLLWAGILSPATALFSQLFAVTVAFLVGFLLLRRLAPALSRSAVPSYHASRWASALLPFTLLAAAGAFNTQIGVLLLGWLGTDEQVAALGVAVRTASLVAFSLVVVNMVIAPHLRRAHQSNDGRLLQQLARKSARVAFAVAALVAVPFIAFSAPVISFVFGAEYVKTTASPLVILAAAQLINVGFGSVGMLLVMAGHEKDTLFGQVIALVVNAILSVILIPSYGAVGAALGASVGIVLWNTILAIRCSQLLQVRASVV